METASQIPKSAAPERILGWREWLELPGFGIPAIKAKIDTGARTSALHAHELEYFRRARREWVRFWIHPLQHDAQLMMRCETPIIDRRTVSDSGGHRERRYVIETPVRVAGVEWTIEVTLTRRDGMLFRMLLGRTGIAGRFLVDPRRSFVTGRPDIKALYPEASK